MCFGAEKNILTIISDKICGINWPGGVSLTFRELSKIFSRNLWAFQDEAMYVCPKRTKFQLDIRTINVISGIVYFREIILDSSLTVIETTTK